MATDPTPDLLFPSSAECRSLGITLPEWLPAMEAAIGFEATKAFLLRHGGRQVAVPVSPSADDVVRGWLRQELGHGRLTVPMGTAARKHRQRLTALSLLREGGSVAQTAARLNVHSRTISAWKADFADRGLLRQTDLAGTPSQ